VHQYWLKNTVNELVKHKYDKNYIIAIVLTHKRLNLHSTVEFPYYYYVCHWKVLGN